MGLLVDGVWRDEWYETGRAGGRFVRPETAFRTQITPETAGPDRYHLYVSLACPWAHRTLIMRALKGLESLIPVSVVNWLMGEQGWTFEPGPGVVPDPLFHAHALHEIYTRAEPQYSGRVSVPVLWDRHAQTIANNESAEIIRMFNGAFDAVGARPGDYYPEPLRTRIDAINERVYDTLNNGVYKAGFATTQHAYEEAVGPLFETLGWLESILSETPFLCGDAMTEADIRLFTTLVRFDSVYVGHFKCNVRRIVDYPALWAYTRRLHQNPRIGPTVDLMHIKRHYYMSHPTINPSRIVPAGPMLDFATPR